ncbi:MAG: sulfatase [bacterium]
MIPEQSILRTFRLSAMLVACCVCYGSSGVPSRALAGDIQPYNVVLIVVDTLRPDYLGCYGDSRQMSPGIDVLATDGILFEIALAHSPSTGPSHASLFTSRLPSETGVLNNMRARVSSRLPMLAELLRARGYSTGAAVSISPVSRKYGFGRGFDTYDDRLDKAWIINADVVLPRSLQILTDLQAPCFFWAHFSDPHEPYDAHGLMEHTATVTVAGDTVASIPTSRYSPTLLELELPEGETEVVLSSPHPIIVRNLALRNLDGELPTLTPARPPVGAYEECRFIIGAAGARRVGLALGLVDLILDEAERQDRYAREVAFTDRHVGRLLDALRERDLYEESLIVFTADHGEALGCHGRVGHIETVYDCMVRIPLIIKPPRSFGLEAGMRRSDPAALVDILPTILAQLDLPIPADTRGRDLLAPGAVQVHPVIFLETHTPEAERTLYGLRGERYKIIWCPDQESWEFYDLVADPGEKSNLYSLSDSLAVVWRDRLREHIAWLEQVSAMELEEVPLDAKTIETLESLGY